jgi:hypothetical protein
LIGESGDEIILIKHLENGTIDTTFGNNGIINHDIEEVNRVFNGAIQEAGKIVVSAKHDMINSDDSVFFIRFLENGLLDTDFGINGIFEPSIFGEFIYTNALVIDNSNRIVAAFANLDANNEAYNSSAYRILPDGEIDDTFGNNGFKELGTFSPKSLIIQTNNRVLIGGGIPFFEGSYLSMKRLLDNGNFDASFTNILVSFAQPSNFLLLNNGKILGLSYTFEFDGPMNFVLSRYNNNPLGTEDHQLEKFSIFPNPSNGIFKIQHDYLTTETPYQITDVLGKIIMTGVLKNNLSEMNLSNMSPGVYYLNASNKTIKLIRK